jgi:hypothetical protein
MSNTSIKLFPGIRGILPLLKTDGRSYSTASNPLLLVTPGPSRLLPRPNPSMFTTRRTCWTLLQSAKEPLVRVFSFGAKTKCWFSSKTPAPPAKRAKRAAGDSLVNSVGFNGSTWANYQWLLTPPKNALKRPHTSREPAMARAPSASVINEAIFQMVQEQNGKDEVKWTKSFSQARRAAESARQRLCDENNTRYDNGDNHDES